MFPFAQSNTDVELKREQIMKNIYQDYGHYLQQENKHEKQITRNLLLVGPSKSGKTTFRHVLTDPRHIPEPLTLHSVSDRQIQLTKNIQLESCCILLNIVEISSKMIDTTSNLSDINRECHKLGMMDFHLVCFCVSFQVGIDGYTLESFLRLTEYFGEEQIRPNFVLIVTRCENKNEVQRSNIHNELLHDSEFANLIRNHTDRIYFSGALNPDDYNNASDGLYYQFHTINSYREKFLRLIQNEVRPFHLVEKLEPFIPK